MAQIANLSEPVNVNGLEFVQPIPIGPLFDVGSITAVGAGVTGVVTNRFPTPPSATAFLVDITQPDYDEFDPQFAPLFDPPLPSQNLVLTSAAGVLFPESSYIEPTLGQIWPRLG